VCALLDSKKSECVRYAVREEPLTPPFAAGSRFWCSQGGRSARGRSHSFRGDLFAVDLASAKEEQEVPILAPVSGELTAFDDCEPRDPGPDARNDDGCGMGYGNHVKIWDGKHLVMLVHLARVTAKPGHIERGMPIGIEGVTGLAGSRHVHVTVTAPLPGEDIAKVRETAGWKFTLPVRVQWAGLGWADEMSCREGPNAPLTSAQGF
jgi:hypothetical protein